MTQEVRPVMPHALDDASIAPYYIQIVGNIRYDIDSGKLREGDRLPSEKQLCDLYHVSRVTVRRALDELADAGYLEKKRGKGTFVKSARELVLVHPRTDIDVISFSEACRRSGMEPGSIELGTMRTGATEDERAFFGLEEGEAVLNVSRVRTADGVRIMYEENRFPAQGFEFLEVGLQPGASLYQLILGQTGKVPHMVGQCMLTSSRASGEMLSHLQVPAGEPLFVLEANYCDADGVPLYMGRQVIIGARYSFAL